MLDSFLSRVLLVVVVAGGDVVVEVGSALPSDSPHAAATIASARRKIPMRLVAMI